MDVLFPALKRLLEGAKNKKGYGYTVTLKAVQTRHAGEISMPDEIYFENVEDYVKFIEKERCGESINTRLVGSSLLID